MRSARRPFLKKALTLLTGAVVAQVIVLVATPVVTRLYSPEDFGIMAFFLALSGILVPLAAFRYEDAILLAAEGQIAVEVLVLAFFVLLGVCASIGLVVGILVWNGVDWLIIGVWVAFIPVAVFIAGLNNILEIWCLRQDKHRAIAGSEVASSSTSVLGRIGLGILYGSSAAGLVLAGLVGQLMRTISLFLLGARPPLRGLGITRHRLLKHAISYKDLPLYSALTGVLKIGTKQLPILLLGYMFAPSIIGFYAVATRVIGLPLSMITKAVRRVYFAHASKRKNKGYSLRRPFVKISVGVILLAVMPLTVVFIWGEPLFAFVLGDQWAVAGRYAGILAPWLLSESVLSVSSTTFVVLRKQALLLRLNICIALVRGGSFGVAYIREMSVDETLALFCMANIVMNVLIIGMAYRSTFETQAT